MPVAGIYSISAAMNPHHTMVRLCHVMYKSGTFTCKRSHPRKYTCTLCSSCLPVLESSDCRTLSNPLSKNTKQVEAYPTILAVDTIAAIHASRLLPTACNVHPQSIDAGEVMLGETRATLAGGLIYKLIGRELAAVQKQQQQQQQHLTAMSEATSETAKAQMTSANC